MGHVARRFRDRVHHWRDCCIDALTGKALAWVMYSHGTGEVRFTRPDWTVPKKKRDLVIAIALLSGMEPTDEGPGDFSCWVHQGESPWPPQVIASSQYQLARAYLEHKRERASNMEAHRGA